MERRIEKRESEAVRNAELQLILVQLTVVPPAVIGMQEFPSPVPVPVSDGAPGQFGP